MIYIHPTNRTESKQLKKYLKLINCYWNSGGKIDPNYNNYRTLKNQTVYRISDNKSVVIMHKDMIESDIYTQNGFMEAAYFNRDDSVIHCPTYEETEKFIEIMNKKLNKDYVYHPYRKRVKGLLCYKVLDEGLSTASWAYYRRKYYSIVTFELLEKVSNLNGIDVGELIWQSTSRS